MVFFFSSRRRHTRWPRDWSSDVCSSDLTTIEGLRDHPLVGAFVRADAVQCGFCTPGQIVSAVALVEANPSPSKDEIRHAMSGNLCRCGTYPKIEEAICTLRVRPAP